MSNLSKREQITKASSASSDRILRGLLRSKYSNALLKLKTREVEERSPEPTPSNGSSSAARRLPLRDADNKRMDNRREIEASKGSQSRGNSSIERTKTTQLPLPFRRAIPTLSELCISRIADMHLHLTDLSGLDEYTGKMILSEIAHRQLLTFRLASVFINSFPGSDIAETLESLDLFAAIPPPLTPGAKSSC